MKVGDIDPKTGLQVIGVTQQSPNGVYVLQKPHGK